MCGMCGFAYADVERRAEPERLSAMSRLIAHRGPDGPGEYFDGPVALGHRRLSIIDVAGGAQPMSNEDGTVWVILNGEIYNFLELRQQLLDRGHCFRTRCDTEVLVHAYEEFGLQFAARLNGMFAFALYDQRQRQLVLGRDHCGVKPLFYSVTEEGLFFGSEIKAVLAGSRRAARMRRESLAEYLLFRYVAGRPTFYEDVFRLEPAHIAVWEDGQLRTSRFWSMPHGRPEAIPAADDAVAELDQRLRLAVNRQMMSEVPLGAFCSGGLDSGLVSGYAAEASPHALRTFSVGFADAAWDERFLARQTASRFKTDHHVHVETASDFAGQWQNALWHHDEPLSHPNSIPLFQLSALARRHVTVVLTGEGSDEMFAGYPRYRIVTVQAAMQAVPSFVREIMAVAVRRLPGHRAKKFAATLPGPIDDSVVLNSAFTDPRLVESLTGVPVPDVLGERRRLLAQAMVPGDWLATTIRYEMTTYLCCLLDRMDRMSMAFGLEARVPFLDLELVEWALGLNPHLLAHAADSKIVVRKLAERRLPRPVAAGAKSGFGVPLDDWFRDRAFAALLNRLRQADSPAREGVSQRPLDAVLTEHASGGAHGELLWLLTNAFAWSDLQMRGVSPVGATQPAA